jgi:hypothetical protein
VSESSDRGPPGRRAGERPGVESRVSRGGGRRLHAAAGPFRQTGRRTEGQPLSRPMPINQGARPGESCGAKPSIVDRRVLLAGPRASRGVPRPAEPSPPDGAQPARRTPSPPSASPGPFTPPWKLRATPLRRGQATLAPATASDSDPTHSPSEWRAGLGRGLPVGPPNEPPTHAQFGLNDRARTRAEPRSRRGAGEPAIARRGAAATPGPERPWSRGAARTPGGPAAARKRSR